jgi:hypothetical protein
MPRKRASPPLAEGGRNAQCPLTAGRVLWIVHVDVVTGGDAVFAFSAAGPPRPHPIRTTASRCSPARALRDQLVQDGHLVDGPSPELFRFAADVAFASPSAAAAVVAALLGAEPSRDGGTICAPVYSARRAVAQAARLAFVLEYRMASNFPAVIVALKAARVVAGVIQPLPKHCRNHRHDSQNVNGPDEETTALLADARSLLNQGFVEEAPVGLADEAWRSDHGGRFGLRITSAGLKAIGVPALAPRLGLLAWLPDAAHKIGIMDRATFSN